MKNSTMLRLVIMIAALTLALGTVACDDNAKVISGENSNAETPNSKDDPDEGVDDEGGEGSEIGGMDEEGHGSAPGEIERIEPGFMNGSWRVGALDQNKPVAFFDTFQDEGDPELTGDFVMGNALYDGGVDEQSGEIVEGSMDGETLTLRWNPTTDLAEVFTLTATRTDDDLLEGKITAKQNPELDYPVSITRQNNE